MVNIDELRELLEMLEARNIAQFEFEEGDRKVRVIRTGGFAPVAAGAAGHAQGPIASQGSGEAPTPVAPISGSTEEAGLHVAKSPIVGTFYRAPDPNSPPFVSVGDRVRVGQVLCIVEAMKLMNEIEAEVAGEIVKVHPEGGSPVQYGDPLFTIRPEK